MKNNHIFLNCVFLRFSVWLFALATLFFCPSQHTLHECLSRRFLVDNHILVFSSLYFVFCILYFVFCILYFVFYNIYAIIYLRIRFVATKQLDKHPWRVCSSINTQNSALYWFMNNWLRLADIKHTDFFFMFNL